MQCTQSEVLLISSLYTVENENEKLRDIVMNTNLAVKVPEKRKRSCEVGHTRCVGNCNQPIWMFVVHASSSHGIWK